MGSEQAREEAEAVAAPPAGLKVDAPGSSASPATAGRDALLAAGGLRAAGGAGGVPRNGRLALARQVRGMQRTHGNAAVRRMLMRAKLYRTAVPPGTPSQVAAWMVERIKPDKAKDVVAVVHGGSVYLFTAEGVHKQTLTLAGPDQFDLHDGVWDARRFSRNLMSFWDYSPEKWFWHSEIGAHAIDDLVIPEHRANFEALRPDPEDGSVYLAVPQPGVVTDEPPEVTVTPPDPDQKWAEKQAREAQQILDAERAATGGERPADGSQPAPGSKSYAIPDRIVPYPHQGGYQINVWVGAAHTVVRQENGESSADLAERIRKATGKLRASRDPRNRTRVKGSRTGKARLGGEQVEGGISATLGMPTDPTGGRASNAPAFPARIVSHGAEGQAGNLEFERTVTGATVNFTMDLDYASMASGFWEEFGMRWQSIDFRWELIDISELDLAQVRGKLAGPTSDDLREQLRLLKEEAANEPDEPTRIRKEAQMKQLEDKLSGLAKEADSGVSRDIARSIGNTWKDTKADLSAMATNPSLGWLAVVAISDIVQVGGALVSGGISTLASPVSDRKVDFSQKGLYLLRCFAQPVITDEDIERIKRKGLEPVIRAASVAILPIEVVPINVRAQQLADAEANQIAELERKRDNPPFPYSREDVQKQLDLALASRADNNEEAVKRSIASAEAELKLIGRWREAQRDSVLLEDRDPALRQWKAMLDIAGVELGVYEKGLRDNLVKLNATLTRVSTGFAIKDTTGPIFRPRLTLVSELDGGVYPIMSNLAEDVSSTAQRRVWRLIDLTSADTQEPYVGSGTTHQAAIRRALDKFAENNPYGRGVIAVRLPSDVLAQKIGETVTVPSLLASAPGDEERAWTRLKDLATAAEIAGLFISGPIGIGIGLAGGVIGGAVAIHNMRRRSAGDRLRLLDFQTGMDLLAVVGAVAGLGAPIAKGVQGAAEAAQLARLAARAKTVAGGLHVIGVGLMAGQVIIIPTALVVALQKIDTAEEQDRLAGKPVDEAKYRAQRFEAWASFVKSGAVAIRSAQMQADPKAGWNPMSDPISTARPTAAQLRGLAAAEGLPAQLRARGVTVEVDPALGATNTVKVTYEYDAATQLVRGVRIRAGRGATANDVALHAPTASAILRYSGLSGRVRVLWSELVALLGGKDPPLYSRAWEAKLELQKLPEIIKDRTAQLADPKTGPALREELTTELGSLEAQVVEHAKTVADMNIDPGRGFVAARGISKARQRAKEAGLEEREGYTYRFREGSWEVLRIDPTNPDTPALRWNAETKKYEPVTGRKPDVSFDDTITAEQAYTALGGYDKLREFGKWVEVVTGDLKLYTHEQLIAKLGDPAGYKTRTVRNRVKDAVAGDILKAIRDPVQAEGDRDVQGGDQGRDAGAPGARRGGARRAAADHREARGGGPRRALRALVPRHVRAGLVGADRRAEEPLPEAHRGPPDRRDGRQQPARDQERRRRPGSGRPRAGRRPDRPDRQHDRHPGPDRAHRRQRHGLVPEPARREGQQGVHGQDPRQPGVQGPRRPVRDLQHQGAADGDHPRERRVPRRERVHHLARPDRAEAQAPGAGHSLSAAGGSSPSSRRSSPPAIVQHSSSRSHSSGRCASARSRSMNT